MKTLITCFLISLLTFGFCIQEASAKRFGGGRSFGVQRSQNSMFSQNANKYKSAYNQRPTSQPSRWGSILGGVLIGGLLTSLFMGHGFGSGILSWLLIAGLAFLVYRLFSNRFSPGLQSRAYQNTNMNSNPNILDNLRQSFNNQNAYSSSAPTEYPANFSEADFLRDAKVKFTRLQAAYDEKNLQDLREFTAPEVFAEIKMQLDERGNAYNKTEVQSLNAELLDLSRQTNTFIASVRFTGMIKEDDQNATALDEIWHFRQFANTNDWVVGGIQQSE